MGPTPQKEVLGVLGLIGSEPTPPSAKQNPKGMGGITHVYPDMATGCGDDEATRETKLLEGKVVKVCAKRKRNAIVHTGAERRC